MPRNMSTDSLGGLMPRNFSSNSLGAVFEQYEGWQGEQDHGNEGAPGPAGGTAADFDFLGARAPPGASPQSPPRPSPRAPGMSGMLQEEGPFPPAASAGPPSTSPPSQATSRSLPFLPALRRGGVGAALLVLSDRVRAG